MLTILGLIPTILTFLTGLSSTAGKISGDIKDLEIAKAQAASNKEKALIDAQIEEAHDRKDAVVAEAGNRLNTIFRGCLALPAAIIIYKLLIWDKVIGSLVGCSGVLGKDLSCSIFRTDALDAYQWGFLTAVTAFYFLYDMGKRK